MPQLSQLALVYQSQWFWLLLVLGAIYFFVGRGIVPKVEATVDARDAKIAADLAEAERLRDEADRILLVRRPESGLLAGMWSLPETKLEKRRSVRSAALALASGYATVIDQPATLTNVEHVFSHMRVTYVPCIVAVRDPRIVDFDPDGAAWLAVADALVKPLPVAMRKILQLSNGGLGGARRGARM